MTPDPADYGFDFERNVATAEGSAVANHLLRELMVAMGLPLTARSVTPREVWRGCLEEICTSSGRLP